MICLGLFSWFLIIRHFFKNEYSDVLYKEYNNACTEYYCEDMGLMPSPKIEKKEFVPPKDPDFWNELN